MPELPEVETTRRGISPHIIGRSVTTVTIRQPRLRWPITSDLANILRGQTLQRIDRRAKYLLLHFDTGCLLIHLGMSGSLRILHSAVEPAKHDHVDLVFDQTSILRYNDPRRFGAILWLGAEVLQHPLLAKLGPEPLSDAFSGAYLFEQSRQRQQCIKQWLMNQSTVTGVGNIYANEALFDSGIHPLRAAKQISLEEYQQLVAEVKRILQAAITQGGTTLRNFTNSEGKPGYFKQQLRVYGRNGQPCRQCQTTLEETRINGRSSVFCPQCQTISA